MEKHKYKVEFEIITEIDNSQKLKGILEDNVIQNVLEETEVIENFKVEHKELI